MSKLLLLSEGGFSEEYKGKKLEDIHLNLKDIEEDNEEVDLDLSDLSDEEGNGVIEITRSNSSGNNISSNYKSRKVVSSPKKMINSPLDHRAEETGRKILR